MTSPLRRPLRHLARLLAVLALFGAGLGGCAPIVGDACETQSDCGTGLFCERSMPGGYCTLRNCEDQGCPDEGVCIRFSADVSWCMQPCASKSDCRDGYTCVTEFGTHPFCNDARGQQP